MIDVLFVDGPKGLIDLESDPVGGKPGLLHRLQAFNQAVQAYNQALALAPGSWWAKVLGLHPARGFALSTPPL